MKDKIGIFDSGIGGYSVLKALQELMPNEKYLYYKDTANNPYGSKNDLELWEIVSNITEHLIKNGAKIIVVACNTATTKCINKLRNKYINTIFVGTEPAIKPVCSGQYKNILLLATPLTVSSDRVKQLIKKHKKESQIIYLEPCYTLANAIENDCKSDIRTILTAVKDKYIENKIDAIILGCTHYSLIKDEINNYFPGIPLIDGTDGVAKETFKQLTIHNLIGSDKGEVVVIDSKKISY